MTRQDWQELAGQWFPAITNAGLRQVTWSAIEPHRDFTVSQLKAT
ncbi:MAG: Transposase [Actinomycetota bacterium]|nr:Transposase [Actinomycetota bacterium]